MSQENSVEQTTSETVIAELKLSEEDEISVQELEAAMKSMVDDVGQISELAAEEKLLVTEFFKSLFKLMQPLTPSMPVSASALPSELGNIAKAYIDPTGRLVLLRKDGQMELKDLSEERNRDIMIMVIKDVMPKFESLTSLLKRKIEKRIQFLSAITHQIQKISEALTTLDTITRK